MTENTREVVKYVVWDEDTGFFLASGDCWTGDITKARLFTTEAQADQNANFAANELVVKVNITFVLEVVEEYA